MDKQPKPVAMLQARLRARFPEAVVDADDPQDSNGPWFLDAKLRGHSLTVQWSSRHGFGISAGRSATYGEGADEVYADLDSAYQRVVDLFLARESTNVPQSVGLAELRRLAGYSQVELARSLDVQQPVISKRERCEDMMLSTLKSTVEALGGVLDLRVVLGKTTVRLDLFDSPASLAQAKGGGSSVGRRASLKRKTS